MSRSVARSVPVIAIGIATAALVAGLATSLLDRIGGFGFGGGEDPTLMFVDGDPDFARLERAFPIDPSLLAELDSLDILAMDQRRLDQLYARLAAGPAPDGLYRARLFSAAGEAAAELSGALAGIGGALPSETDEALARTARLLWSWRVAEPNSGVVRSVTGDFSDVQITVTEVSVLEGVPPNYRDFATTRLPRGGLLGLFLSTREAYLLFPARLRCGESLLDPRRASHVLDHRRNDTLEAYRRVPDLLAGARGLALSEEMRLVRPGLYLGRAYAGGVFVGNLLLDREAPDEALDRFAESGAEPGPCGAPGTQAALQ